MLGKRIVLLIILAISVYHLNAQEKNKLTVTLETGLLISPDFENLGLVLQLEPKLKINANSVIGLRYGFAINSRAIKNYNSFEYNTDGESFSSVISITPTFDYYFYKNQSSFNPYLGAGLGYYVLKDMEISRPVINTDADVFNGSIKNQFGFLIRSGFETGKLRLSLEYNFIPKAEINISNGDVVGAINDSYFGITLGLIIGGGKRSK